MTTKSTRVATHRLKASPSNPQKISVLKKTIKPKKSAPPEAEPTQRSTSLVSLNWNDREKCLLAAFGPVSPRGKVFVEEGHWATLQEAAEKKLCVMAFPPRGDRLNWVYVSHGLSHHGAKKQELAVFWKSKESTSNPAPELIALTRYAQHVPTLVVGDILVHGEALNLSNATYKHWMVCSPKNVLRDPLSASTPAASGSGSNGHLVLLVGLSLAEYEAVLKVKPELCDGRKVLLEALKLGGIFPITDPERTCLTRRRDFHRLWEQAFRTIRGV